MVGMDTEVEVAAGVEEVFVGVAAGFVAVAAVVAVDVFAASSSVGVADVVSSTVGVLDGFGVLEGRDVFVVVAGRLGVKEGIAVS